MQFSNSIGKLNTVCIRKDSGIADSEGALKCMVKIHENTSKGAQFS